ncbi:prepilin-type N-terminal cleavage/methylation domain-containing protein [Massilia aquatica]|uniref:Prepilin-type N-terminal cleavage/methylation domain-containing protein n=1 Tax=Massilia aquatica TaxID=2609000 RepID=A0ABX0LXM9_9BURK|nr:prepilin-type N-terminal cleavage/methylation domain-containing protein [Massilia aquatica]NHZ39613.1 prepilin-type N-terminal cleavage/methylation domain-containing protein [Massilia aquatica]
MKRVQGGFSLVEMAVVLVIAGLMIGGLLTPLAVQMEQRKISDTQKTMDEAREALMGFALRNGYLPCPAVSPVNGLEDRSGATCRDGKRQGVLPWATLGLPKLDSWGRAFHYSVAPAYSNSGTMFTLQSPRDITVGTRDARGNLVAATAINDIPAVIVSHGKNGAGGFGDSGIRMADTSSTNLDERTNAGSTGIAFVTRTPSDSPTAPGGEYDDLVIWLSPNVLFNRMVAAGTLPR